MKYCKNCGKQLPDNARFCIDCGTPIEEASYYVAVNGQPTGPYAVAALREMMLNGQLTRLSLVWKDGMAGWSAVENVGDLKPILGAVIPPIPTV